MQLRNILVRSANWVGDAVMSIPALQALRAYHPEARISILARPGVADLHAREKFCDEWIPYTAPRGLRGLSAQWRVARELRRRQFDAAVLLQNAFEAAAVAWMAGIPVRIGFSRDGRGPLLTHPIPVPKAGEIGTHQRFYYFELMRRSGLIPSDAAPPEAIRLEGAAAAARNGTERLNRFGLHAPVIGVAPGAAYGSAKRWFPERFADAALEMVRERGRSVVVFGSREESELCGKVKDRVSEGGALCESLAGRTTLGELIDCAAACDVFLTNDSGSMHIASALGVPTVAVFGATDDSATGPTGKQALVVRHPVECSPCLLRECPIDHRCMTGVSAHIVATEALKLAGGVVRY